MSSMLEISENIISGAIRAGTPVLYVVLGEIITEKAGIINLGVEGVMLISGLASVIVSFYTQEPLLGVLAAFLVGGVLGSIHAVGSISFNANQIALGLAITFLGAGLSAFLGISFVGLKITSLDPLPIPFLNELPFFGKSFFAHDILVYFSFILIPIIAFIFSKTKYGIEIIACGEDPEAALKTGINVKRVRYLCTIIGSGIAGIGGAYLALVYTQGWVENMSLGRGLVGVGLVIFSFWSPWRAFPAVFIYGAAISIQLQLQARGANISQYLIGMVPYVAVIIALVFATLKLKSNTSNMPKFLGKPFLKS